MAKEIPQAHYASEMLEVLEELFDVHHGFFLDKGTSLFPTLEEVSAEQASSPIAKGTISIASHVEHVILYLDVLGNHMAGSPVGEVDWSGTWDRVGKVAPEAWDDLRARLRAKYAWLVEIVNGVADWRENDAVGASMVILAHTACHLGVIRQALANLGDPGAAVSGTPEGSS